MITADRRAGVARTTAEPRLILAVVCSLIVSGLTLSPKGARASDVDDFERPSAVSYRIGPDYLVTPGLQNLMGVYGRARLRAGTIAVAVLPRLRPHKHLRRAACDELLPPNPYPPGVVLDDEGFRVDDFDYRAGFTPQWDDWEADPGAVWVLGNNGLEKLEED